MLWSIFSWVVSFLSAWHPPSPGIPFTVEYCVDLNQRSPHHSTVDVELLRFHCTTIVDALSRYPWASKYPDLVVANDLFPFTILREPPISSIAAYTELRDYVRSILAGSPCFIVDCAVVAINTFVWNISSPPIIYGPGPAIGINSYGVDETAATSSASCTGLSIFLATSLRMVGIPARIAGVVNWNLSRKQCPRGIASPACGNHSWVEVFVTSYGWSFVDQRRPDFVVPPLNQSWFYPDRIQGNTIPFSERHSVYAASYLDPRELVEGGYPKGTGVEIASHYRMEWAFDDQTVFGWDVSASYKVNRENDEV